MSWTNRGAVANGDRVKQAVILAAGNGRRLSHRSALPKPLLETGGRPLLQHVFDRLSGRGFQEAFVVIGYEAERIRRHDFEGDFEVSWVHNPRHLLPNGLSLLAAAPYVRQPFLLLMADHLFQRETLDALLQAPLPDSGGVLATDAKTDSIFDLPDATKVKSDVGAVLEIGKDLSEFDSIDTGMFVLHESAFDAMRDSVALGDSSLTGGISALAAREGVRTWDIGQRLWIDVDTLEAHAEAERMLDTGVLG